MTNKYICELCGEPCILEVEKAASKPIQCPYGETEEPEWELMKTRTIPVIKRFPAW